MTITPAEKFNLEVWWVIKQLKYLQFSTKKDRPLEFCIEARPYTSSDAPIPRAQENALLKLEEWRALKVIDEPEEIQRTYGKDFIYTLELLQHKFDELYRLYERDIQPFEEKLAKRELQEKVTDAIFPPLIPKQPSTEPNTDFSTTRKASIEFAEKKLEEYHREEAIADIVVEKLKANSSNALPQDKRPYCIVEGKWGFLKFNKMGQKIKISSVNSQPFRLLQCLTEPFGIAKSVDIVFEAIRENVKYKSKSGIYTSGIDRAQKIKLIGYVIKDLQKGNKLQGKLAFKWDDLKIKIWLEYLG